MEPSGFAVIAASVTILAAMLPAQVDAPQPTGSAAPLVAADTEVLGAGRAAELLGYLASDALAGRDSPSPGLEEAALFVAWSFQRAGLRPGGARFGEPDAEFFHRYALEGVRLDTAGSELTVDGRALTPESDFRLWSAGRPFAADDLEFAPLTAVSQGGRPSRPAFVVVTADDPAWRAARDGRALLSRRAPGAAPVVLVRQGAVPDPAATATLRVPAPAAVPIPLKNVVAWLPGAERPDEFVLVTAHYDHVGVAPQPGDDGVFNGADDNATGTTAVLALAEFFAAAPRRLARSVMFVAFSAEEKGLRGSAAFVAEPPIPLASIVAVVNIEMLGRPDRDTEPFVWITGEGLSDLAAFAAPALQRAGVALTDFAMADQLFFQSDNAPFAPAGVVAHSFSAGQLHADYHRVGDEVQKLDIPHLCAAVRGIAAVVEELATRTDRPTYTESAREQFQKRRR